MSNKQEAPMIYESPIEFRNWANMVQWQQKKKKKEDLLLLFYQYIVHQLNINIGFLFVFLHSRYPVD